MRLIVFLVVNLNIFVLAIAEQKNLSECLARLAHCAEYGYTVKENGDDYMTAKIPFVGQNAIKSQDVFLQVFYKSTGEPYFTKNNFFYIEHGFLRVSENMVLLEVGENANNWSFRIKETSIGKRYFIDVYDTGNHGAPFYTDKPINWRHLDTIELSYFHCSEMTEAYDNAYFKFRNSSKCADVLFEKDAICMSNVDTRKEFECLKEYEDFFADEERQALMIHLLELCDGYRGEYGQLFQIEKNAVELLRKWRSVE